MRSKSRWGSQGRGAGRIALVSAILVVVGVRYSCAAQRGPVGTCCIALRTQGHEQHPASVHIGAWLRLALAAACLSSTTHSPSPPVACPCSRQMPASAADGSIANGLAATEQYKYDGFEASLALIERELRRGAEQGDPVAGLLGFSQVGCWGSRRWAA